MQKALATGKSPGMRAHVLILTLPRCSSEGTRVKGQKFSVGSGSPYAYGVLDEGYKFDMEVEEACELGRRSIYHATFRDAMSGGFVSVYHVHADGWTKISCDDCQLLHERYEAAKGN